MIRFVDTVCYVLLIQISCIINLGVPPIFGSGGLRHCNAAKKSKAQSHSDSNQKRRQIPVRSGEMTNVPHWCDVYGASPVFRYLIRGMLIAQVVVGNDTCALDGR